MFSVQAFGSPVEDKGESIMPEPVGVERLIAQQEIKDLCCRYARGSDRADAGIFTSTFWEDGGYSQLDSNKPNAKIDGEVISGFMSKRFSCTQHLNCNILVDFVDEDHATTEVYFQAFHLTRANLKSDEVLALVGARRFAELSHVDGSVYEAVFMRSLSAGVISIMSSVATASGRSRLGA
jgi:hypothetical protein